MKIAELRAKNEKELLTMLKKAQSAVESSVSDVLQGKSKDTSKTKYLRREVAQVKTVLKEKELIKETKDA